jgi:hypothetical protein
MVSRRAPVRHRRCELRLAPEHPPIGTARHRVAAAEHLERAQRVERERGTIDPGAAVRNRVVNAPVEAILGAIEPLAREPGTALESLAKPGAEGAEPAEDFGAIGQHHLHGRGGRGGPRIRDEIGKGEVGLVPHGRHHRDLRRRDGTAHSFEIERGEVILRSPAPPHHAHIDFEPVDQGERVHQGTLGGFALHHAPHHDDPRGPAPPRHGDHVVQRRAVHTGDDGHPARKPRQCALPRGIEEAVLGQRFLHPLQLELRVAHSRGGQDGDRRHPELAPLGPEIGPREDVHLGARLRCHARALRVCGPHDALDGSVSVAEGEKPVAGLIDLQLADLTLHPDLAQGALDRASERVDDI